MQWMVTIAPAVLPVTADQVYAQARIDDTADNATWVTDHLQSAVDYAESEIQCSLITRTIAATYWPESSQALPEAMPFPAYSVLQLFRGPVQSVISVLDRYGNALNWQPRNVGTICGVQLNVSAIGPVTITYTAGYGNTAAAVPADIRHAILAHVGHMYRYREADDASIPKGLSYIYDKYRAGGDAG